MPHRGHSLALVQGPDSGCRGSVTLHHDTGGLLQPLLSPGWPGRGCEQERGTQAVLGSF